MAASGYPEAYKKGEIINLPIEESNSKIFHAGTSLDAGNITSNGGRVLCATALGRDIKEAQEKAYQLINSVSWEGSYYRTDIGFKGI
jgi:phosphoribosylamine--glycine ligase